MTWKNPLWLQSSTFTYPAQEDRFIIDTLFTEGVMNVAAGQGLAVQRPAGANMQVYVPPLDCIIKGDDNPLQGSYLGRMTAAEFVDVTAPSTTNPRIDLLVAEITDTQYVTATATLKEGIHLRIVPGTPAASPVAPGLPNTAIPLAQIAVAANAVSIVTANITDLRTQSGAASLQIGTQFVKYTTAQRDALSNVVVGTSIFNTTTLKNETYLGPAFGWVSGRFDVQTFTASGTWTKPLGAQLVFPIVIGGGGSGAGGQVGVAANNNRGSGGGGGACAVATIPASILGATEPVTVGSGGAAVGGGVNGLSGSPSQFSTLRAGGGGGGINGAYTAGAATGGVGGSVYPLITPAVSTGNPQSGSGGLAGIQGAGGPGSRAEYGGGGGGNGPSQTAATTGYNFQGDGGGSVYGGGGGGAGALSTAAASDVPGGVGGGTTSNDNIRVLGYGGVGGRGGAGGNTTTVSNPATAGSIPGGGGGGGGSLYSTTPQVSGFTGAAGARGEVRVYTVCV